MDGAKLIGVIFLVVAVFAGLIAFTFRNQLALSPTTASISSTSDDPVISAISADIRTPVYFLLSDYSLCQGRDGNFMIFTARLVRKSYLNLAESHNLADYPLATYAYFPDSQFVMSVAMANMGIFAAPRPTPNCFDVNSGLQATAISQDLGSGTATFRVYDMGSFELRSAVLLNEVNGTDPQMGVATKFRSYRIEVVFRPNHLTGQFLHAGGLNGLSCIDGFKLNQMTLQWSMISNECRYQRFS